MVFTTSNPETDLKIWVFSTSNPETDFATTSNPETDVRKQFLQHQILKQM